MRNGEPATAGHGEQIVNNPSIGRDSVMQEAPCATTSNASTRTNAATPTSRSWVMMRSPSDKDRPGGKHPSEPSETVFLPHSRTLRTDISLFSNLPPESLGYIYPVLLLGWETAVRNVRNSGVRSSFESQSLALWRYSRIA